MTLSKQNKILIVHNNYRHIGGEDISVEKEVTFLSKFNDVKTIYFNNEIKSYLKQFYYFFVNSNKESTNDFIKNYLEYKPDVVYIHNLWFKASLGILKFLKNENVKVFIKIHNFRYDCASSFFKINHLNNKNYCNACGFSEKDSFLINKYFKESYLKSFLVILFSKKYIKLVENSKFTVLVLTKFHFDYIKNKKYKFNRVKVFPNYLDLNTITSTKENYIIYAGRISYEKGVKELITSFLKVAKVNDVLRLAGDGPDLEKLKYKFRNSKNILFDGYLDNDTVINLISKSKAVVTATRLYEGQPTLLCEASLLSVPSIYPRTGGIGEFFPENYPFSFEQYNYEKLSEVFFNVLNSESLDFYGGENKKFIENKLEFNLMKKEFSHLLNYNE